MLESTFCYETIRRASKWFVSHTKVTQNVEFVNTRHNTITQLLYVYIFTMFIVYLSHIVTIVIIQHYSCILTEEKILHGFWQCS